MTTKTLWLTAFLLALAGCSENKAATKACKANGDANACNTCCKSNGATGYKFINGDCGCLGGGK